MADQRLTTASACRMLTAVMDTDDEKLDYNRLVLDALLDVPRRILAQVAERGLPGEHFFYVGFRTAAPGVRLPSFLRAQFPEEMTIILQNQFWDLEVTVEAFSVSLNFNASRQRLTVPFSALTTFVDPSTEFGLRFDGVSGPAAADSTADSARGPVAVGAPGEAEPETRRPTAKPTAIKAGKGDQGGEVVPFGPRQRK